MVSYYNPSAMYRHHQQAVTASAAAPGPGHQFHAANTAMHQWYAAGYHHQGAQMGGAPPASYCMQDEQQMWHHHAHSAAAAAAHSAFPDFPDYVHMPQIHHQHDLNGENQLPSPPITVSGGSDNMSSPGAGSGHLSPHSPQPQQHHHQQQQVGSRPPPARSPYEWIKKTSYQTQPNPGKTRTKDKYRVVYTDHQRIELEKEFTFNNKYITIRRKTELASNLGLSERQIKIWFQNRRAKERKQTKKSIEEKNFIDINSPYQQQQTLSVAATNMPHHMQSLPTPHTLVAIAGTPML